MTKNKIKKIKITISINITMYVNPRKNSLEDNTIPVTLKLQYT